MTGTKSTLQILPDLGDLGAVRNGKLSCFSLRLKEGGLCLYSPVAKQSAAFSGGPTVRFLLAPNHYHNKALAEHVSAFPEARAVCSKAAMTRLEKVTGLRFSGLDMLRRELPDHVTILEPAGLKTGEIWFRVEVGRDVAWIVTDAFCGLPGTAGQEPKIGFLKTFPQYGVKDATVFSDWVRERLQRENPVAVLPSHGEIVKGPGLREAILGLLSELTID